MTTYTTETEAAPDRRRRVVALAIVGAILLAGALGLNVAAEALELSFKKEAVPPRKPVAAIPAEMGPWVQVTIDQRFPPEIEEELGTDQYISRTYVDVRRAEADVRADWEAAEVKDEALRHRLIESVHRRDRNGVVQLHVPYYTGSVDTVPHIPDRCMLGAGFDLAEAGTRTLDVLPPGGRPLTVSYREFQQRGRGGQVDMTNTVLYFFQVNGDYEYDAITGVRKRLQNLLESHAYFAKIEVGVTAPTDPTAGDSAALAALQDFLQHAMPGIEAVLPDWQAVKAAE